MGPVPDFLIMVPTEQPIVRQSQTVPHIRYTNSAGGVVLNPEGKMVLVLQRNGVWSFPKGKIEEGEERVLAARREITEETGITELTQVETLGSYTKYSIDDSGREDKSQLKRITVMLFTTPEKELRPADPRIREAKWVSPEEAVDLLTVPKDQEFLTSVLERL